MNVLAIIQKSESLPFSFDRGSESTAGYICTINVKQFPGDAATISRVVALTDGTWSGFLTSTETTTIGAVSLGLWFLTAVLVKSSTDEQEEIPERFSLSKSWA